MATVCDHLSVEELEERYVGCQDATAERGDPACPAAVVPSGRQCRQVRVLSTLLRGSTNEAISHGLIPPPPRPVGPVREPRCPPPAIERPSYDRP
jgi:hypothetical protein